MAFADTPQGDELMRVDGARCALRDASPQFQGPNPPTQQQLSLEKRRDQLQAERDATRAYQQFQQQAMEEEKRIYQEHWDGTRLLQVGDWPEKMASNVVKERWVEQGIWNDNWKGGWIGGWKHQEPLEIESDWETDPETSLPPFPFQTPKATRLKDEETRRKIAEKRLIREREREASWPYHQFMYQLSRERERMLEGSNDENRIADNVDTRAYNAVKGTWLRRKIWDEQWGTMPGMSWKHEKPWDEALTELGLHWPSDVRDPCVPKSETDCYTIAFRPVGPSRWGKN